jgi:hypothetical protein
MPFTDYFSAADDQAALGVNDLPGGPRQAALDAVELGDIDPVVALAQLEAIMAGCTYQEAYQRPRSGQLLSSPESDSSFVVSVSDTLRELLASATGDDLARAAGPWAATDEMRLYQVDAAGAAAALAELAGLARRAQAGGMGLYCWWVL